MDSCESVLDHFYPPDFFAQFGRSLLSPYLPAEEREGRALLGWAIQADVNKTADFGNAFWGSLLNKRTVGEVGQPRPAPKAVAVAFLRQIGAYKGSYRWITSDGLAATTLSFNCCRTPDRTVRRR